MFVKVLKYSAKEQRCRFTEYLICFSVSNVQISNLPAEIATEVERTRSAFDGLAASTVPLQLRCTDRAKEAVRWKWNLSSCPLSISFNSVRCRLDRAAKAIRPNLGKLRAEK